MNESIGAGIGLPGYDPQGFFCEIFGGAQGAPAPSPAIQERLKQLDTNDLSARAKAAEEELFNLGITFTVYTEREAIDRILPFDVIPRLIGAREWVGLDRGVKQRVTALNHFLHDIYHDQKIIKDGVVPSELINGNKNFRPQMVGLNLPHDTYVHICGIDLVRGADGAFRVLEDNARTPSGVSYVIENRHMMLRAFPDLTRDIGLRDVDEYGARLHKAMHEVAPVDIDEPQVVLLSPGTYNSAYFEHIFLAREMGVPLVEGRDLLVGEDDRVYMRTTAGLAPVHAIYRRIDDDFIDPEVFREDSMLGVPGLMRAYWKGNVTLANAVGTGVVDDKAVYAYMPRVIKYYLDEDPIIENVETHICGEAEGLRYTLDNLDKLVVKPVGESGGYGILIGPQASKEELAQFREKLKADPANFISQPVISLSVCPTLVDGRIEPRHVDLRPFCITGRDSWVLPGGLTRVAIKRGSLVVNSSQGGGSKDTWVLTE
ncbi:circularly permuted type 2 ATP-grasp protein [Marivibrio halodurans]|uniref:Circularly permuted type 2 ATP-grasp protein n=1 Tax=Marivibrio halodurans TaxID=2039722 RepID=A0A8J7UZQ6_9PROT|nr:circularly permuted type 2 ATP-grasp protein [Marivibrio halodurans]MBP5855931.1 circularly permuted type 2 ATP-grasp protein [Marivibrio halodurans]